MKTLVVYYSYSGITRRLAEDIALITDGELRELKAKKPYSFSYHTAVKEVREEIEKGYCPPLAQGAEPVEDAERIFIGSPNWLHTFAPPVLSFLRTVDLSGKTIIPFCSHGGGRFGQSLAFIAKLAPDAMIGEGLAISYSGGESLPSDVSTWLEVNKVKQ